MTNRRRISSGSSLEQLIGYCRALRVDDRVLVSGTGPTWEDGSCDPDPVAQTKRSLATISTALSELDLSIEDVVRTRLFITNVNDGLEIAKAHGEVFGDIRPATTCVVVAALMDPRWKVEIEAEAVARPGSGRS